MRALLFAVGLATGCGRVAFDTTGGSDLLLMSLVENWQQAVDACRQLDPPAHLATITTVEDNLAAAGLAATIAFNPAQTTNQRQRMWLGASSLATVGEWVWITGEPFAYSNWRTGEPGSPMTERCLILLGSQDGLWDDRPCTSAFDAFLCERD